jgi:hypothetical protein
MLSSQTSEPNGEEAVVAAAVLVGGVILAGGTAFALTIAWLTTRFDAAVE